MHIILRWEWSYDNIHISTSRCVWLLAYWLSVCNFILSTQQTHAHTAIHIYSLVGAGLRTTDERPDHSVENPFGSTAATGNYLCLVCVPLCVCRAYEWRVRYCRCRCSLLPPHQTSNSGCNERFAFEIARIHSATTTGNGRKSIHTLDFFFLFVQIRMSARIISASLAVASLCVRILSV